jgi:outer membrane lipoprotein-sorting protein
MNSADKIKRFFKNAELGINPDADEKVFNDVLAQQKKIEKLSPGFLAKARGGGSIWRITMKSPITKIAVAAVLVIACLTGVLIFEKTASIALAEVLDKFEQITAYSCRMNATFNNKDIDNMPVSQSTMLMSQTFGSKMNVEITHPITGESMVQEIYILPNKGTITTLMPNQKKYSQVYYDKESADASQQGMNPRDILEQILKCEHTSLGCSTIDGVEVEGFQTTDPSFTEGVLGQATIKIWVDVETKLPVRMEVNQGDEQTGRVQMTLTDFKWNIPVDEADFEPVILDDYTLGQPMLQMLPPGK